jgi:hypothetical protein
LCYNVNKYKKMKLSLIHVSVGTVLCISLLSIATEANAAFSPDFYKQRELDRQMAQQQVQIDQFDRQYAVSATSTFRETPQRTTGVVGVSGKGKGKGVPVTVTPPPIAYVTRERVVLPPLTDSGPMLQLTALLTLGIAIGYRATKTRVI